MVVLKKQAHGACNGRPGTSINRRPVSRRPISHARARRYLREHWRIGSGAGACEIQVSLLGVFCSVIAQDQMMFAPIALGRSSDKGLGAGYRWDGAGVLPSGLGSAAEADAEWCGGQFNQFKTPDQEAWDLLDLPEGASERAKTR